MAKCAGKRSGELAENDATDASFIAGEFAAVGTPLRVDGTIPEPKKDRLMTQVRCGGANRPQSPVIWRLYA